MKNRILWFSFILTHLYVLQNSRINNDLQSKNMIQLFWMYFYDYMCDYSKYDENEKVLGISSIEQHVFVYKAGRKTWKEPYRIYFRTI